MTGFKNADGKSVLLKMVTAIQENKGYLSEVDGLIGDGDHGMNMNKGFTMFESRIAGREITFSAGLNELGTLLFTKIGGSMGPIYGTMFIEMAEAIKDLDVIDTDGLAVMLTAGLDSVCDIVEARVGDKTLVDTLSPARTAAVNAAAEDICLTAALKNIREAAAKGRDSTKELVAKFGRSSRLGERSKGVLDAGATSCCLILTAIADGILANIDK